MYWIYLIADGRGTVPYLTDRALRALSGDRSAEVRLVASYPTLGQAWAHLVEMPATWAPSRRPGEQ